jgi:hypothetical protein
MANAVQKVNGIDIGDIQAINGVTDDNLQALNTLEFTGTPADAHVLIATATSDGSDSSLGFTSGIDSTYDVYEFIFTNIHPQTDDKDFEFQVNAHDGSSQLTGFNETITSTFFATWHDEGDSSTHVGYRTAEDQAQGTAYQTLYDRVDSANDAATSGILTLYAPSSTTYVKHFVSRLNGMHADSYTMECYAAGYINTTNAITQIDFKFESGEIQGGEIKMYGLKKS